MIFVFGGAYQGKREFVENTFNIQEGEECLIDNLNEWIRNLVEEGRDSDSEVDAMILDIKEREEKLAGKEIVVIMDDISQGIVPMDALERAYREANGRAMIKLAKHATKVYRVFCGIGVQIK